MNINSHIYSNKTATIRQEYVAKSPFPYLEVSDFLVPESIEQVHTDFPSVEDSFWTHYIHYNEKKHGLTKWEHFPNSIKEVILELRQPPFISWIEGITGYQNLFADPDLEGSGLHQTKTGGFLNIHADFSVHPKHKTWQRRVNVLLFLNKDWNPDWGGSLELWNADMSKCEVKITPDHNKLVVFSTGKSTFHGYPTPITCPDYIARKSIALYYYTEEASPISTSTNYQARPIDGAKKWLIYGDTLVISLYTKIKGIFGLNDDFASSILRFFNKK